MVGKLQFTVNIEHPVALYCKGTLGGGAGNFPTVIPIPIQVR